MIKLPLNIRIKLPFNICGKRYSIHTIALLGGIPFTVWCYYENESNDYGYPSGVALILVLLLLIGYTVASSRVEEQPADQGTDSPDATSEPTPEPETPDPTPPEDE